AGLDNVYDETVDPRRQLRPHWQTFEESLNEIGLDEFTLRWRDAQQLIRENGVTYNVYGDPRGMDRPWQLDPIPLLMSPAEWRVLEDGLIQRASLLDMILADLYGPQHLLGRGFLPPELVFGNPAFLHPCHAMQVPANRYLHLYAANL